MGAAYFFGSAMICNANNRTSSSQSTVQRVVHAAHLQSVPPHDAIQRT